MHPARKPWIDFSTGWKTFPCPKTGWFDFSDTAAQTKTTDSVAKGWVNFRTGWISYPCPRTGWVSFTDSWYDFHCPRTGWVSFTDSWCPRYCEKRSVFHRILGSRVSYWEHGRCVM